MALAKSDLKNAYPLPSYNYRVEIGGVSVGFSDVSGLSSRHEVTTYKESPVSGDGPGPVVMRMPAQAVPVTMTLKKGVVRKGSVAALYKWISSIQLNQVEKKDIYVRLCDEKGEAVISWKVINAFPTRLDAPSFSAGSNESAIETMELVADSLLIEEA